jgi:hypothetical protein
LRGLTGSSCFTLGPAGKSAIEAAIAIPQAIGHRRGMPAEIQETKSQQRCRQVENNAIAFRHVYLHCELLKKAAEFEVIAAMDNGTRCGEGM